MTDVLRIGNMPAGAVVRIEETIDGEKRFTVRAIIGGTHPIHERFRRTAILSVKQYDRDGRLRYDRSGGEPCYCWTDKLAPAGYIFGGHWLKKEGA